MSIYQRPGASCYSYDFQFRGVGFHGSTGCETKPDAERFEKAERQRQKAAASQASKPMTFGLATTRYWTEVGQFHADPESCMRNLAWLQRAVGLETPITEITNATVAGLVALRRGEGVQPATVNRSMMEPLRTILRRAEEVWGAPVTKITWKLHRLKEPQERVREASIAEEEKLLASVPADYQPVVKFAILTECRRGEIVGLTWQTVNFFAREFRVAGKGDRSRTIPMTEEVYALLWDLKDHHKATVFTFEAERTRDGRTKGQRYPITANGLQTVWNRYVRPNVNDFRFHDTRHTAATRLVRQTGNLKLAQGLLGHTSVTTTGRYAHVTHEDLRAGLEKVAAARPS